MMYPLLVSILILHVVSTCGHIVDRISWKIGDIFGPMPGMPEEHRNINFNHYMVTQSLDNLSQQIQTAELRENSDDQKIIDDAKSKIRSLRSVMEDSGCSDRELIAKAMKSNNLVNSHPKLESIVIIENMIQLSSCLRGFRHAGQLISLDSSKLSQLIAKIRLPDSGYTERGIITNNDLLLRSVVRAIDDVILGDVKRLRFDSWRDHRIAVEDAFWDELVVPCDSFRNIYGTIISYVKEFLHWNPKPVSLDLLYLKQRNFDYTRNWFNTYKLCDYLQGITVYLLHIETLYKINEEEKIKFLDEIWSTNNPLASSPTKESIFRILLETIEPQDFPIHRLWTIMKNTSRFKKAPNVHQLLRAAFRSDFSSGMQVRLDEFMKNLEIPMNFITARHLDTLIWFIKKVARQDGEQYLLDSSTVEQYYYDGLVADWRHVCEEVQTRNLSTVCQDLLFGPVNEIKRRLENMMNPICQVLLDRERINLLNDFEELFGLNEEFFLQEASHIHIKWITRAHVCRAVMKHRVDYELLMEEVNQSSSRDAASSSSQSTE